MTPDPIIAPEQLASVASPLLIDARAGEEGRRAYAAAHLEGAVHLDLETDLAAAVADPSQGGRHPLPPIDDFCRLLGRFGITPDREIVVYDAMGGAMAAARLWWMLRALGFQRVRLLDGGFQAAQAAGLALATGAEPVTAAADERLLASGFTELPTVDAAGVREALADPKRRVIDVRSAARFRGEQEPIDPIAGHIPGAWNVPYAENLDEQGRFKSAEALRALYTARLQTADLEGAVVHCGSGVTACHTLLALQRAGVASAALYVGSWSEWCRNPWPREP